MLVSSRLRALTAACVVAAGLTVGVAPAAQAAAPTASIVVADTALRAGEASLVTITFSEAVTGLDYADLTVANGTLSGLSTADNITYTATLTPSASTTDPTNVISLDNTAVQNGGGEPGVGVTDSNNYAIDSARPTATIVVADNDLRAGDTSLVTITFSEAVTGLDGVDLSVANGSVSTLTSTDGGITWTATLTPSASATDPTNVVTLDNTGVQDTAGNTGTGTTSSNNYAVSTVRPIATIVVTDTALRNGETSLVTVTFSEAVTGLDLADLTVANGTLSGLSSSDGGVTWTATLTPSPSTTDGTNLISLDVTGVQNGAGNAGTGTTDSNNYAIDTQAPTATVVVADDALAIGETSLVTITFSEPVVGFSLADLNPANGALSGLSTADHITYTATFTPSASVDDASNVITLNAGGVVDAAGNGNSGASSDNYVIDSTRPTATIVVADSNLRAGETSLVTTTFSEAVVGFDNADLSVDNGTLSAVSSSDGGVTWTATLTPTPSTTDASNVVTLANAGVTDVAGNAGAGTTSSGNYTVDTVPVVPPDRVPPVSGASGPAYSQDATWVITYAATDGASGIASVDLYVQAPGESAYTKIATDSASQDGRFTYTGSADGTYRFHTIATDRAGNVETAPASADGTTVLDSHAPASQTSGPSLTGASTWTITYDATDATSGVGSVDLYVRAPGETTYTKVATDSSDLDGRFTYTGAADGTYRFHTVATDRAGNTEPAPAQPDVVTVLDTRAPVLRAIGRAPLTFDLSQDRAVALRFRSDETVSATFRIRKRGTTINTLGASVGGPGVLERLWRGRTDDGTRVRPGRYRVVVIGEDAAGNRSQASVRVRVRR